MAEKKEKKKKSELDGKQQCKIRQQDQAAHYLESLRVTVPEISRRKKRKNNEANWMVSNSAKLDRRTKQHTQFGVSTSNGSRDMARTKSRRKKKIIKKKKKITKRIGWQAIVQN